MRTPNGGLRIVGCSTWVPESIVCYLFFVCVCVSAFERQRCHAALSLLKAIHAGGLHWRTQNGLGACAMITTNVSILRSA